MIRIKNSSQHNARLFSCLSGIVGCVWFLGLGSVPAASLAGDLDSCQKNLATVFQAIQEYRYHNKLLPNQLSDLVPAYLAQSNLECPASRVASNAEIFSGTRQPGAGATYVYEFQQAPLTNALARGFPLTLQSWRQLQMGRMGSDVPMVRCTNHASVIHLSFGGEIRESPEPESGFGSLDRPLDLSPESLLKANLRLKVVRIPAREQHTRPELLDLTPYYNGSLSGWIEGREGNALPVLKTGRMLVNGVSFDARGVIQLGSLRYRMSNWPTNILNVAIEMRCESLVFLHGTFQKEAPGSLVGQYIIHFENDATNVLSMVYGSNVLDCTESDPNLSQSLEDLQKIGSSGEPVVAVEDNGVRFYVCHWRNPYPNQRITHFDFTSGMTQSSPFLVAVTAVPTSELKDRP